MKQVNKLKTPVFIKSSDLAKLLRISYTKLVYYLKEKEVVVHHGFPGTGYESWIYNRYGHYGIESEILLTRKGQNGVLNMLIKDGLSEVTKRRVTESDRKAKNFWKKSRESLNRSTEQ